jgi:AcrR family transcriptional regulator
MRDGTATRERIDQKAMALFASKGVAETTIRDIAQSAGIAEGALYRHYRSKDELIVALFARHYRAFAQRLDMLQAAFPHSRDKIAAMVEECCRVFDQDPMLFRFLLLVQHQSLQRVEGPESPVEVVRRVIEGGMARGEIRRDDPELGTALVMGIIIQPATFKTYGGLPGPMLLLASRLTAACWSILQA